MKTTVGCVKAASEILGDKWTPQLLRFIANEASIGFCQLQDLAGGINPRTLSARLNKLEAHDIITRTFRDASTRSQYSLTPKGSALIPILKDMESWGKSYTAVQA